MLTLFIILGSVGLGSFAMIEPSYRLLNRRDASANLFLDIGPAGFDWPTVLPSYPPASPVAFIDLVTSSGQVGEQARDDTGRWLRIATPGTPIGYLSQENYEIMAAGRYQICLYYRSNSMPDDLIGELHTSVSSKGRENMFIWPILNSNDNANTSSCTELWLDTRYWVEFKFWYGGQHFVGLDKISFERLGPWSNTLYNVAGTLDFSNANLQMYLLDGWSTPENWGRWAIGLSSAIKLRLPQRCDTQLTLYAFPYWDENQRQLIRIYYDEHWLATEALPNRDVQPIRVTIPRELITSRIDVLRFEYGYAASPAEAGTGGDQRQLSVGFVEMEFTCLP